MGERQLVGIVSKLNRYRVKSMAGESVASVKVTHNGLEDDRQFAFVKETRRRFPWLTGRDNFQMLLCTPVLNLQTQAIEVTLPDGRKFPLDSDDLRKILEDGATHKPSIHLVRLDKGAYDTNPIPTVSVIGNETVRTISRRSRIKKDARRFRANIEVETTDRKDGAEDAWVGGIITFGDRDDSPQLKITELDRRCMMINIDPETGKPSRNVLDYVINRRGGTAGVYATVEREGVIRQGDPVYLTRTEQK